MVDEEGLLTMTSMPTASQAELLRKLVGLRKSSPLTEERREMLRGFRLSPAQRGVSGDFIAPEASEEGKTAPAPQPSANEQITEDEPG